MAYIAVNLKVLIFLTLVSVCASKLQSYGVRGTILCNSGEPIAGATIELWDQDSPDPNDIMARGVSDGKGEFAINGETNEFLRIEPFIKVMIPLSADVKQCPSNPQATPGYTVCAIRFLHPDYIVPGHFNGIYFDIGTLTFRRGDATQGSHIWSKTWPKSQDPIDEEACHENIH